MNELKERWKRMVCEFEEEGELKEDEVLVVGWRRREVAGSGMGRWGSVDIGERM